MSYTRKPTHRRLGLIAFSIVSVIAGAALMLYAAHGQRKWALEQCRIVEGTGRQLVELVRLRETCQRVLSAQQPLDAKALIPEIAELSEDVADGMKPLLRMYDRLKLRDETDELRDELEDIRDATARLNETGELDRSIISTLMHNAQSAELHSREALRSAAWVVSARLERDRILLHSSSFLLGLGTLTLVVLGLLLLSDTLNQLTRPSDIGQQLRQLSRHHPFRADMRRLLAERGVEAPQGPWTLEVSETIHTHRTHSTFRVCAINGDMRVDLWGKMYTWSGRMKGFQRLFRAAYGRSTWAAMQRMRTHGLPCPMPIARIDIRRNRFAVGNILLTEHLGKMAPLKRILKSGFDAMTPENRKALLIQLGDFYNRLHACGIRSVKPRYPHVSLEVGQFDPRSGPIYLFDLDKVCVGPDKSPNWIERHFCRRDDRRLIRALEPYLMPEELEVLCDRLEYA